MKKLAILLALMLALSCLFIACDTPDEEPDTSAGETVTDAPVETGLPTEEVTEDADDAPSAKVTYTVTVKDQNGDPVVGAAVQMCDDKGCKLPVATNAEGVATFTYDPSHYHVTIQECPQGYTADPEQEYYFEGDSTELTVTITKN